MTIVGKGLLEKLVQEREQQVHFERLRVATYFMATPLVLSFAFVDYIFRPDLMLEFLFVRLGIVPVSIVMHFLFKLRSVKEGKYFIPSYFLLTYLGLYSAYLCMRSGADTSIYYTGLNLVAMGTFSFLPWRKRHLPVAVLLIYAPYFLMIMLNSQGINTQYFIPYTAFMLSTTFLGLITHELTHRLKRREVLYEMQLQTEIANKDIVIQDKTREGVQLEKLASQFSPQVIKAIRTGELNVRDRNRREITCVFIDIENSTRRTGRLDFSEYANVVSDFFSNCTEIFIEHDVTIGTFLGDGMLAFTNAPLKSADHQVRALEACLKILEVHNRKKRYYNEKWRTDFNIRIGINSGFASVGFYPNDKIGTYTAIGESVNLASRLCSKALPNHICVNKAFLKSCVPEIKNLEAQSHGYVEDLKGFEGEKFELFSLKKTNSSIKNETCCPLCSGTLVVAEDMGGSSVVRCSSCNYYDIVDKSNQTPQAA